MVTGNFKIALDSIKSAKWRSLFTMLGIIIGVASVVTIVSIGEGVKNQIIGQISHFGPDLITVRPGKTLKDAGYIPGVQLSTSVVSEPLSENDVKAVSGAKNVKTVVPLSYVTAEPKVEKRTFTQSFVMGTSKDLPEVFNQKVRYGEFFKADDQKNVAVIGKNVAEELFQEQVPIGRSMEIRGQLFVVLGVFDEFETAALTPLANYNSAIFIPLESAKKLTNNQANIQQILVKPDTPELTGAVVQDIQKRLKNAHSGQDDFSVLKQEDNLAITSSILDLLTGLISGVAAISLIVGGIGIMNVMIVSVTERTSEIGIRKAVGATNRQILAQFLIESSVISFVGGILGVVLSLFMNFILRISTDLQPAISVATMLIAILVALIVGVVFGVAPALRAANKDPIEALRHI